MYGIELTRQMVFAWIWFSLYMLLAQLISLISPSVPTEYKLAMICIAVLNGFVFVNFIRAFRGQYRNLHDNSENAKKLSAWGYLWRVYITHLVGLPILLVFIFAFSIDINGIKSSSTGLLLVNLLYLFCSSIGAWLFFSKDRVGQLKMVFSAFRGY